MPRIDRNFGALETSKSTPALITTLLTPLHNPTMLLRFESPNGQFRLSVEPKDPFSSLTSKVGFNPKADVHRLGRQNVNLGRPQLVDHVSPKTVASAITLSNTQ